MSAEIMRQAAALMRERAEAAGEWNADIEPGGSLHLWVPDYDPSDPTGQTGMQRLVGGADAPWSAYIATMHPGVGLAVADWLDATAQRIEEIIHESLPFSARLTLGSLNVTAAEQAFAVARAYLGGEA